MSLVVTGVLANASLQEDRRRLQRILADSDLSLSALLALVLDYLGAPHADLMGKIAARIAALAVEAKVLEPGQPAFKADGCFQDALLALVPDRSAPYVPLLSPDDAVEMPLLDETPNVHVSKELPARINRRLDHQVCPAFKAYRVERHRLYVGPQGFAVFDARDRKAVAAATSRPFGAALFDLEPALTAVIPVLVQDVFNGFNFSHFLFDWIARATVFATSQHFDPQRHVFVFGGMPNRFHHIVIEGLKAAFGLTDLNIFFPTEPAVLDCPQGIVYFSDNVKVLAHPAQMCRGETVSLLRKVVAAAPVERPPGTRRIYISRGDAGRRMLTNERALFAALEQLGFEGVRMADHPMEKQIALISSAECIVGAHGMGLTHMAFHPGHLRVVELFNPEIGTDTYAFPAKALGFDYHPVVGTREEGSENFTIDVAAVLAALEGLPPRSPERPFEPARRLEDDLVQWFPGVQPIKAVEVDPQSLDYPGPPLLCHMRDPIVLDTNVGWWRVTKLQSGNIYRLSCHILITKDFAGDRVILTVSDRGSVEGDIAIRDRWQPLSIMFTCPDDEHEVNMVLRVFTQSETWVFSAGWEVTSGLF